MTKTLRLACLIACTIVTSAVSAQTSDDSTSSTDDSGSSSTSSDTTSDSPSTSGSTSGSTSTSTSTTTSSATSPTTTTTTTTSSSHPLATSTSSPSSAASTTSTSGTSHTTSAGSGTTTTGAGTGTGTGTGAATPPPPEHQEGDGRDVDFLWIEAFGGVANVNLVAFQNSNFADVATGSASVFNNVNATGPMLGGALGFRIYWLAVGVRTTFAAYNVFQIGTVGGEVALRFPIPVVEPYIRAGFGYAWMGDSHYNVSTSTGITTHPETTVYGWAFNAAVGADIFLTNWFTIGGGVGFDLLNMTRQSDPRQPCMGVTDFCPMRSGDAVGYQVSGFGQIGFHI